MAAYVIFQTEVLDPERYEEYKLKAGPHLIASGGKYIIRGGDIEVLEGEPPAGRTVVLEFATMQAASDWYHSDEYTAARKLREGASIGRMYIVDGVD